MDPTELVKDAVDVAPTVFQLLQMAVQLVQTWATGSAQDKAAAEAAAQAACSAMDDARNTTAAAHQQRVDDFSAKFDKGQ